MIRKFALMLSYTLIVCLVLISLSLIDVRFLSINLWIPPEVFPVKIL